MILPKFFPHRPLISRKFTGLINYFNQSEPFKLGCANVNGLRSKLHQLTAELAVENYTAFAVQESKLDSSMPSGDLLIPGYNFYRLDRPVRKDWADVSSQRNGGVAVYVKQGIPALPMENPFHPDLEILPVKLYLPCGDGEGEGGTKPIIFASLYRRPSLSTAQQRTEWVENFSKFLRSINEQEKRTTDPGPGSSCGRNMVIVGDFNLDIRQRESHSVRELLAKNHMSVLNREMPTHQRRVIDWIAVGTDVPQQSFHYLPSLENYSVFGHRTLKLHLTPRSFSYWTPKPAVPERQVKQLDWSRTDWTNCADSLVSLLSEFGDGSKRKSAGELQREFARIIDRVKTVHVPSKIEPVFPAPEVSDEIRSSVTQAVHCFNQYFSNPDSSASAVNQDLLEKAVNAKRAEIDSTRRLSYETLIQSYGRNYCRAFKRLTDQIPQDLPVFLVKSSTLSNNGSSKRKQEEALITDAEKCQALLDHRKNLESKTSTPNATPSKTQSMLIPVEKKKEETTPVSASCSLDFINQYLRCSKRTPPRSHQSVLGPDDLPPIVFRNLREYLAPALQLLINRAMHDQRVPSGWKTAKIVPKNTCCSSLPASIHPASVPVNSIVSLLPKLYEAWLLKLLEPYTRTSDFQFAGKPGSGCSDALFCYQEKISAWNDESKETELKGVMMVSLDLNEIQQELHSDIIIKELERRKTPAYLRHLVADYLQNRTEYVQINETRSELRSLGPTGLPTGSALCQKLFTVALDGLFQLKLNNNSHFQLFHGSGLLMKPVTQASDLDDLQTDIGKIRSHLMSRLRYKLTAEQCRCMLIYRDEASLTPDVSLPRLKVAARRPEDIRQVSELSYCGTVIDERLTFRSHWQAVTGRADNRLASLHRFIRGWDSEKLAETVYQRSILASLTYSLAPCYPSDQGTWALLEEVQQFAAKLSLNMIHRSETPAALVDHLGWDDLRLTAMKSMFAHMIKKTERQKTTVSEGDMRLYSKINDDNGSHSSDRQISTPYGRMQKLWAAAASSGTAMYGTNLQPANVKALNKNLRTLYGIALDRNLL